MNTTAGLSIVIATEGRTDLTVSLIVKLYALRAKVNFPTEVLVVDSSQSRDRDKILEACRQYEAILIPGLASVRSKRNTGIRNARFSIILFLDSDCLPSETLLTEHWKYYQDPGSLSIGGVLGKLEFVGAKTMAWQLVEHSTLVRHFDISDKPANVRWGPTANLSIRRDVLFEIELFDETFPFKLGGDDLDLTYRMTQRGHNLIYNPLAVAFHSRSTWNSLSAVLGRSLRWGRMEYHLYKKHEKLRAFHPPTLFGWFVAICMFSVTYGILSKSFLLLLLPCVWLLLATSLFSILSALMGDGSYVEKWLRFRENILSTIPELTYQTGSSLEFLLHGDFRFFYSRPTLSIGSTNDNWIPEAINSWSNMLALLISYSFMLWFLE